MKNRFVLVVLSVLLVCGLTFAQRKGEKAKPQHEFVPPQANATAEPEYPNNSIAQGSVILQVTIATDGSLEDLDVLKPLPSLTEEVKKAVRKWTFTAATLDGKPVRSTMVVSFTFRTIIPPAK
ncbi:MAG: energy transducer TonB [Acidobacteria bacterium]|nr:energy transducer TonB [Acidobacteriota bacterium]